MKIIPIVLLLLLAACAQNEKKAGGGTQVTTNDTIPEVRTTITKTPVASYMVPLGDPVQKWYFGVQVFETPATFKYLLRMQNEGVVNTDTLKLPNFGTWPIVEVRKGDDKMSCIIGFLDKQKVFKPYKKLVVEGNDMKLVVIKRYSVGVTQKTD